MNDPLTWIVFAVGYAPLHYLGPLMVAWFTGAETPTQRRRLVGGLLADATVSMLAAFALAWWLLEVRPQLAMWVLLLAMFAPYAYLWRYRRRHRIAWSATERAQ